MHDLSTFLDMFSKDKTLFQAGVVLSLAAMVLYTIRFLLKGKGDGSQNDPPYGLKLHNFLPRWVCGIMYSRNALAMIKSARAQVSPPLLMSMQYQSLMTWSQSIPTLRTKSHVWTPIW